MQVNESHGWPDNRRGKVPVSMTVVQLAQFICTHMINALCRAAPQQYGHPAAMIANKQGFRDMSSTVQPADFNHTVGNIKQNVEAATAAQSHASERVWNTGKEFAAFNQSLLQAFFEAGQIYAQGSQDLFRQVAESAQAAFHETLNDVRAVATAKTAKERVELQANFARSTALRTIAESNRFANAGIELAEKVAAPLTTVTITAAESLTFSKV